MSQETRAALVRALQKKEQEEIAAQSNVHLAAYPDPYKKAQQRRALVDEIGQRHALPKREVPYGAQFRFAMMNTHRTTEDPTDSPWNWVLGKGPNNDAPGYIEPRDPWEDDLDPALTARDRETERRIQRRFEGLGTQEMSSAIDPEGRELLAWKLVGGPDSKSLTDPEVMTLFRVLTDEWENNLVGGLVTFPAPDMDHKEAGSRGDWVTGGVGPQRAGDISVISHETGHAIVARSSMLDRFLRHLSHYDESDLLDSERTKLQKTEIERQLIEASFQWRQKDLEGQTLERQTGWLDYRLDPDEVMADNIGWYMQDPDAYKAYAPAGAAFIREVINTDPFLSKYISFAKRDDGVSYG